MLKLTCPSATHDFTTKLRGDTGIPYKPLTTVRKMQSMQLWINRTNAADGINSIQFDYCYGSTCTKPQASNFARFKVRILRNTIRPAVGDNRGFLTVIARVRAVSTNGVAETQAKFLKLYALEGSAFYTTLDNQRDNTGSVPTSRSASSSSVRDEQTSRSYHAERKAESHLALRALGVTGRVVAGVCSS